MALGSTQLRTEMSSRNLPVDKGRPERKANNLTSVCEPIYLESLDGPLQGYAELILSGCNPVNTAV
jgi:hypothetical protein